VRLMITPVEVGPRRGTTLAAPVVVQLDRSPRSNPPLRMPSRVISGLANALRLMFTLTVEPDDMILPAAEPLDPRNGSKPVTLNGPPLINSAYPPKALVTATRRFVELLTTTPALATPPSVTTPVANPEPVFAMKA